MWTAVKTDEGKEYYFHTLTKKTTWSKPVELMTPMERELDAISWRKATSADQRDYYYHVQTNQTTWEMPDEYKRVVQKYMQVGERLDVRNVVLKAAIEAAGDEQVYIPKEEADDMFMDLLEECGVDQSWSWEDVLRATIDKPEYRAIKTIQERKQVFQKYLQLFYKRKKEEEKISFEQDRKLAYQAFDKHPRIHCFSRFGKVQRILCNDAGYNRIDLKTRRVLFEDWARLNRQKQREESVKQRQENMEKFKLMLQTMHLTIHSTWKEVKKTYESKKTYQQDLELQKMEPVDFLNVFEQQMKPIEDVFYAKKRKERSIKFRQERKNRELFVNLLQQLKSEKKLHVKSKWKDIYPLIKEEAAFLNMLGQPGSTPLELFWDELSELELELDRFRSKVNELKRHIQMKPDMTFSVFIAQLPDDEVATLDMHYLKIVFDEYLDQLSLKAKEDQRKLDKRIRRHMDDFRYRLKKLDPPLTMDASWDAVEPRVSHLEEYLDLNQEQRLEAFEKFKRRLARREAEKSDSEEEERRRKRRKKREEMISYD